MVVLLIVACEESQHHALSGHALCHKIEQGGAAGGETRHGDKSLSSESPRVLR